MTQSVLRHRFHVFLSTLALAVLAMTACTSKPVQTLSGDDTRGPASDHSAVRSIQIHDPESNDFKAETLHLKTYSVDSSATRERLKTMLDGLLAKKDDRMSDSATRALEAAVAILAKMNSKGATPADFRQLQEAVEGFNLSFIDPMPNVWIGSAPFAAINYIRHTIMSDEASEAKDVQATGVKDKSKVDPAPSSFWKADREVADVNMYYGFGRDKLPEFDQPCKYESPKTSYGMHPGFKVKCGKEKWKLKFAYDGSESKKKHSHEVTGSESKSEPFNSRFVWALGFNALMYDYLKPGLRVKYKRKLLTEYNSRQPMQLKITSVLGFSYYKKDLQTAWNPFSSAIQGVILKDGTFVPAKTVQANLIRVTDTNKPNWKTYSNIEFNQAYEKRIKDFVLAEGNVEKKGPKDFDEIGQWDWNSLDRENLRAYRAFAIVAAFTNQYDMRANNNKVFARQTGDGSLEFMHMVSDVGSGLVDSTNFFKSAHGTLAQFPWDIVRKHIDTTSTDQDQQGQSYQSPYEFPTYSPIEQNNPYAKIQLDDARWIVRRIAQFSESQFQDALIASGFNAAETRFTLERLVERQKQLVQVFGLSDEFPALIARKIDRHLNYDPKADEIPTAVGSRDGAKPLVSRQKVEDGELVDSDD